MNDPFAEFLSPSNKEAAMEKFQKILEDTEKTLIIEGFRAAGLPDKVCEFFERLMEYGCPPVAIMKAVVDKYTEDDDNDE